MGYQNAPATRIVTRTGQPVLWTVDMENKTVTVYIGGVNMGTWPNRTAAIEALGLVEVPTKGKQA